MGKSSSSIDSSIKKLIGDSSLATFSKFLTKGLNFVFQILLGRYLGPTTYGWFVVGQSYISVGKTVSLLGLHNSVTKFVSQYHGEGDHARVLGTISFSALISGGLSLTASIIIVIHPHLISVGIFGNPDLSQTIRMFSLLLPVYTFLQLSKSFLQAVQSFFWMSLGSVLKPVLEVVAILITIYLSLEYYVLLWLIVVFTLLSLLVVLVMICLIAYRRMEWSGLTISWRQILRVGIPLFFSGIAFTVMSKVDIFFIEFYTDSESVGIYNAALLLSGFISLPLTGLNKAASPMISDLYNQDKMAELTRLLHVSSRWISTIGVGAGLVLLLFSEEVIQVWGSGYSSGGVFLSILVLPKIINSITGSSGFVLQMTGNQDYVFMNNILSLIINIVLNIILIPRIGPIGAAIGTAIALSLNNFLCLIEVRSQVGLSMHSWSSFRILIPGLTVLPVSYLLGKTAIGWMPNLGAVILIYTLISLGTLPKKDKRFLLNMTYNK